MELILGFAFILISVAILLTLKISVKDIVDFSQLMKKNQTLKQMSKNKKSKLVIAIKRIRAMMRATGQGNRFYILCFVSVLLMIAGIFIGISINNYFLCPVLAIGLMTMPFIYIQFQYLSYKRLVVEELEGCLSTVSLSYERGENILVAIEENLPYINQPIKTVFTEFVHEVKHINPNIVTAIDNMQNKINHSTFFKWCEALKHCIADRTLKYTLRPIVDELTDIKVVTGDLRTILYKCKRTFWQLLLCTIVALYVGLFVLPDAFQVSIPEMLSNVLIAVNSGLIIFTTVKVLLETKSIDYDL